MGFYIVRVFWLEAVTAKSWILDCEKPKLQSARRDVPAGKAPALIIFAERKKTATLTAWKA